MSDDKKEIEEDAKETSGVTQDQFEALQTQLTAAMETVNAQKESIDKLSTNNEALLDEKRAEEVAAEKARMDKLTADGDHKTLLDEERMKFEQDRKDMMSKVDTLSKQLHGVTGDGVLSATLESVGLNPAMKDVVASKFRHEWSFDDGGHVMHNGKPLADSIKEWAESDAGKVFLVSDNSGSGAKPSTSNKPIQKKQSEMSEEEILRAVEDGTLEDDGNTWM